MKYLDSVGIRNRDIENMAASCRYLLHVPVLNMRAVVEYLQGLGIQGTLLNHLLVRHPKLLMYEPRDGLLVRDKARAQVEIDPGTGGKTDSVRVHVWREGATFDTAPIAPPHPLGS